MPGDQPKTDSVPGPKLLRGLFLHSSDQTVAGARESVLGCGEMADSEITSFDGVSEA